MENNKNGHADEHRKNFVEIEINEVKYDIHRGNQSVQTIKDVGKVPLNHMLEQVVDGELVQLDDNGSVVIKGGEVFISHPKDGGSA